MVPYPCSRGLFLWGSPIWVPEQANEQEMQAKRLELETALNRLTAEADKAVNKKM
jgi:hypothetical protein